MNTICQSACFMALALGASGLVRADVITADTADVQVQNNNGAPEVNENTADYAARVGEFFGRGAAYVAPFQLPTTLPATGFTNADLRVQLFGKVGEPAFNADLYGLSRIADTPEVLASDFYAGANDTTATKIQDDFFNPASPVRTDATTGPFISTDALGDTALVTFLNAALAGGANAGQYVFLRLNPDVDTFEGNLAYQPLTANAGGPQEKPIITYNEVIPEPGSLALLGLSAGGLLLRRRRA